MLMMFDDVDVMDDVDVVSSDRVLMMKCSKFDDVS